MGCILCETGRGTTRRKAVHDLYLLRCYHCERTYDPKLFVGELCPLCGRRMTPAISHYVVVCSNCGTPLA